MEEGRRRRRELGMRRREEALLLGEGIKGQEREGTACLLPVS